MATTQHTTKTNISRSHNLLGYLAAIGLAQELHTLDPTTTTHWEGYLIVDSTLSTDDIESHLANDYAPVGIIAPWQNANGMWSKDKGTKQALDIIINSNDKRASKLQVAYSIAEDVIRNHLCNIGEERPDKDTQDAIQEELANNYPGHDIGKYAAYLLEPTRPLPGNKGTNGRYTYSGEHIRAAARLISTDTKMRAKDHVDNWAANITQPNSNLPMSRINYSGLCPQEGKAIAYALSEAKQGNPLLLMLAMQGLISTRYAVQYSSYTHILTPLWRKPITYSQLCGQWLDAARHVRPAHRALSADNAHITAGITGDNYCAAYVYEKGYIGRDQIHAKLLGYISLDSPDEAVSINIPADHSMYYRITHVGKPISDSDKQANREIYGKLHRLQQVAPNGIQGVLLEPGRHTIAVGQLIAQWIEDGHNTAMSCYLVRREGLERVGSWHVSDRAVPNPLHAGLTGKRLRDIWARYGIDYRNGDRWANYTTNI